MMSTKDHNNALYLRLLWFGTHYIHVMSVGYYDCGLSNKNLEGVALRQHAGSEVSATGTKTRLSWCDPASSRVFYSPPPCSAFYFSATAESVSELSLRCLLPPPSTGGVGSHSTLLPHPQWPLLLGGSGPTNP